MKNEGGGLDGQADRLRSGENWGNRTCGYIQAHWKRQDARRFSGTRRQEFGPAGQVLLRASSRSSQVMCGGLATGPLGALNSAPGGVSSGVQNTLNGAFKTSSSSDPCNLPGFARKMAASMLTRESYWEFRSYTPKGSTVATLPNVSGRPQGASQSRFPFMCKTQPVQLRVFWSTRERNPGNPVSSNLYEW